MPRSATLPSSSDIPFSNNLRLGRLILSPGHQIEASGYHLIV